MNKEFYDKYSKELKCSECLGLSECLNDSNIPLCNSGYIRFAKDKIADLEAKLAELNKEPLNCSQLENGMSLCIIQKSKIAELEAKIAELREQITICNEENSKSFIKSVNAMRENAELKQQLAEKEKEIETLKFMMRNMEQASRNVPNAMAGQRKRIDELTKELKQHNQDKISFAVEQLEKVKEFCEANCEKCDDPDSEYSCKVIGLDDILYTGDMSLFEYIDNQIKQLKEGK